MWQKIGLFPCAPTLTPPCGRVWAEFMRVSMQTAGRALQCRSLLPVALSMLAFVARRVDGPPPLRPGSFRRRHDARASVRLLEALRAEFPGLPLTDLYALAGQRLGFSPETVRRHHLYPEVLPRPGGGGRRGRPRGGGFWNDERRKQAMRAWRARHGRWPTRMDWSPEQLRQRAHATAPQRIADFRAGWEDEHGIRRVFPRAGSIEFRRLLDELIAEESARGGS